MARVNKEIEESMVAKARKIEMEEILGRFVNELQAKKFSFILTVCDPAKTPIAVASWGPSHALTEMLARGVHAVSQLFSLEIQRRKKIMADNGLDADTWEEKTEGQDYGR